MEFWGTKVRSGESIHVNIGIGNVLYLTQVSLGKTKKETTKSVCLYLTFDGNKFVLGTLHPLRLPVRKFDVLLDKGFEISHNQENGYVYFYGFKTQQFVMPESEDDTNSDDDEDNDDEVVDEEEETPPKDEYDFFDDDEEEEETPPKKQSGRKRPKAAASKTPSTNKKAKKSEGKKGGVATPRPSKQAAAKKPAGGNKSNQKFPASDDAHILKPRKRHTSK